MAEEVKKEDEVIKDAAVEVVDPIAEKDAKIAKLEEDLSNYKAVALKRLGKLPGDAEFLAGNDDDKKELSVAEQIKIALLEKEVELEKRAKDEEVKKIVRENSELKLALKNRPQSSIGGEGSATLESKDNVFSTQQIAELTNKAKQLGFDPVKFIERAKNNLKAQK